MKLLAHRGASRDAPENTLEAFREAARQGADGVELDAMVCASGEVVVCHDERLHRLAGRDWEVARTSLRKLREADVGTPLGFSPARIPLLEEVLDELPGHFVVNIELKCDSVEDRGLAMQVGELVMRRGLVEQVLVSSFNPWCLFRLAAGHPHVKRGLLIDQARSFAAQALVLAPLLASHSVHPFYEDCTEARVQRWQAQGWEVVTWTVDDVEVARRLERWGVGYCITNCPGHLRAQLQALNEKVVRGPGA